MVEVSKTNGRYFPRLVLTKHKHTCTKATLCPDTGHPLCLSHLQVDQIGEPMARPTFISASWAYGRRQWTMVWCPFSYSQWTKNGFCDFKKLRRKKKEWDTSHMVYTPKIFTFRLLVVTTIGAQMYPAWVHAGKHFLYQPQSQERPEMPWKGEANITSVFLRTSRKKTLSNEPRKEQGEALVSMYTRRPFSWVTQEVSTGTSAGESSGCHLPLCPQAESHCAVGLTILPMERPRCP